MMLTANRTCQNVESLENRVIEHFANFNYMKVYEGPKPGNDEVALSVYVSPYTGQIAQITTSDTKLSVEFLELERGYEKLQEAREIIKKAVAQNRIDIEFLHKCNDYYDME